MRMRMRHAIRFLSQACQQTRLLQQILAGRIGLVCSNAPEITHNRSQTTVHSWFGGHCRSQMRRNKLMPKRLRNHRPKQRQNSTVTSMHIVASVPNSGLNLPAGRARPLPTSRHKPTQRFKCEVRELLPFVLFHCSSNT